MRENCTLRLCYAMASQAGSMKGCRRKTTKSVLRVAEGQAGVPTRDAPLYSTLHSMEAHGSFDEGRSDLHLHPILCCREF